MVILQKPYSKWSDTVQRSLDKLTLPNGYMKKCIAANPDVISFVAFEGENPVGWAIISINELGNHFQIFVGENYRRNNIASQIVEEVLKEYKKIVVTYWNETSRKFFHKVFRQYPMRIKMIDYFSLVKSLKDLTPIEAS